MAFDAPTVLEAAIEAATLFLEAAVAVEIVGILLDQGLDPSDSLVPMVTISYRIRGRPGTLSVQVPYSATWYYDAYPRIAIEAGRVNAIYEGAPNADATFDLPPEAVRLGGATAV